MLQIHCSGTPHEIGLRHGQEAKLQVSRTIAFYAGLFEQTAKKDWPQVRVIASEFTPVIREKWPAYYEEMVGLAEGAGVEVIDIVAINVRTEINYGLFSDGCTALAWKTDTSSFLAQNWDWQKAQQQNLILQTITQPSFPIIKQVTEAGLLGKIGLNSAGVGVCLNAIRAHGTDSTRIPVHLALRKVLESESRAAAVAALEAAGGVASACHILIADATGGVGLEFSAVDRQVLEMNARGQVFHSNHWLVPHLGVVDAGMGRDSVERVGRIEELCGAVAAEMEREEGGVGRLGLERLQRVFEDEEGYPGSICRMQEGVSESASLFNIVMELRGKVARVRLGRPVAPVESFELSF